MSESEHMFNHAETANSSTENVHGLVEQPTSLAEASKKIQQQQKRQKLSCIKCRERKVKCDRTKPCSACCARGIPKECKFEAEGDDYAPIQQSYELRKLRAENIRLKERLRASKMSLEEDDLAQTGSQDSQPGERPTSRSHLRRSTKQKRFQGSEWSDSIYFGSPGLASVINEFANINLNPSPQTLSHLMPRGADMYAPRDTRPYPFATLFSAAPEKCIPELLECLPAKSELISYLESFEKRVPVCAFPHVPVEITRNEVERFFSDVENAERYPDMLGLLFAALALGSQHSVWDRCGGKWLAGEMDKELQKGDVYIAAAKQALRLACYTRKPTLLGIQALIMIGPYLTNSGRFLDAWTLFGTTIRLAQSIGLHRNPKYLDPAPPTERECSIRQQLWWWMLHMDQQYSMTLGRPLGISGIGDCPFPHELTVSPTHLRFGKFVRDFTILARHILGSDRLSNAKIDEFTDALRGLLDTMPEVLQFNESWLDENNAIPEWPLGAMAAMFYCQTHNYLILLNRQRLDKQVPKTSVLPLSSPKSLVSPAAFNSVIDSTLSRPSSATAKPLFRGRPLVLSSSQDLLTAFLFFYARVPAALICWNMGQQAFNSCMILLLDAMETGDLSRIGKVERAYAVFVELDKNGVHKLANLAVDRISWGLKELRQMSDQAWDGVKTESNRTRKEGGNVNMQGVTRSEASQGSGQFQDTVMGNTGMLLLEDPGLQSFVPEGFAPFTWDISGGEIGRAGSEQFERRQERQGEQMRHERLDRESLDQQFRDPHYARPSEEFQGVHGSALGSAQSRYATFRTGPTQTQNQPQGLTSPTSHMPSTTTLQQPRVRFQGMIQELNFLSLPRHFSYPSLHHQEPEPLGSFMQRQHNDSTFTPEDQIGSNLSRPPDLLTSLDPAQTPSGVTAQRLHHAGNPSVHPSWAARPAAPLSALSETALSFSHIPDQGQALPSHAQPPIQQDARTAYQSAFSMHVSSAAYDAKPNVTNFAAIGDENMEIEGWRRWGQQ